MTLESILTIMGMVAVTQLTRMSGYFLLRNKKLSARGQAMMESAPPCVLIALIAPYFVSRELDMMLTAFATVFLALKFDMLRTVLLAVGLNALLKFLLT